MKVFALGGYGKVGFPAIKLLAQSDLVAEIAIVGRSLERAQKAATEIGEKGIAVHADGTDEQKLTSLLAGYDIIMNAADNKVVLPSIRAAIHNGAHYCDVASLGDLVEQTLQLASDAEAAGITAIFASGVTPSISNLMGVHMARQLGEVEQLQLGFVAFVDFQGGELTHQHWLEQPRQSLAALHEFRPFLTYMFRNLQENVSRTALIYYDGRWIEIDPIRNGVDVPHLQGGTITSYPYVSCDSLWGAVPRDLAKVSPVEVWFSPLPPQLDAVLRQQALRVLEENTDPDTAISSFYDTADSDPQRWLTLPDDFVPVSKVWVRAVGRKQGRAARCSCWFTAPMWDVTGKFLTSVALAVAVRKILRGEIRERGVMPAETAFEPVSFFDEVVAVLPEPPADGRFIGESFEWLE